MESRDPKFEVQIRDKFKTANSQWRFETTFEFGACFGFRVSNFGFRRAPPPAASFRISAPAV